MIAELINETVEEIRLMLLEKNQAYGNSAIDPVRIFSRADRIEQIKVRIDDKISRVMRGSELAGESSVDDLIGYLVLLKIARRIEDASIAQAEEKRAMDNYYRMNQPLQQPFAPSSPPDYDPLAGLADGLTRFHQNNVQG